MTVGLTVTFLVSAVSGVALGDADRGERSAFRFPTPTGLPEVTVTEVSNVEDEQESDEDVQQEKSNSGKRYN